MEAASDAAGAGVRARGLFPRLFAWHRWWHEIRDPDSTGLVTVVHPWETGRDNSPEWDAPLARVTPRLDVAKLRRDKTHVNAAERPTDDFYNRVMTLVEEAKALRWDGVGVARGLSFRVCDIGVQSILMRADRDLLALAERLGFPVEAQRLRAWIDRCRSAFASLRHADGTFRSLDLASGRLAPMNTSGSFLSLYARACEQGDADLWARELERWRAAAPYAVASTDPGAAEFDPVRYWRGPVWLVVNRLIADGFAAYGHTQTAAAIRAGSRELAHRHGLREYYDPRNGKGLGGKDFSWSAAVWLSWLSSARDGNARRDLITAA